MSPVNPAQKDFWIEFLQIYQENPCLWDKNCADYKNQSKKNLAFGILIEKLWEINESADYETAKKKIGSFRSSFRREVLRVKDYQRRGKAYVSPWVYYPYLTFLWTQEQGRDDEDDDAIEINSDSEAETRLDTMAQDTPNASPKNNIATSLPAEDRNATDQDSEDDCSTCAAHIKTRLRALDPQQKCIAQKLLFDVMFMAETKQLKLTSHIVNPE